MNESLHPSIGLVQLIQYFEGFRPRPYLDTATPPRATIGYGSTYYKDGRRVTMQDAPISRADALALLLDRLEHEYVPQINRVVTVALNQNQFDALTDFVYNCGIGNLAKSTLLKLVNAEKWAEAAEELDKWTSGGVPGLVRRRAAEKTLFLKPVSA